MSETKISISHKRVIFISFLVDVFTDGTIEKYGLTLLESGQSTNYDQSCNPGITVGFSTAAFRFGHSQVILLSFFVS